MIMIILKDVGIISAGIDKSEEIFFYIFYFTNAQIPTPTAA